MPVGVAGRRLATLLGATALVVSLAACGGSQIDERTATRVSVERGTTTTTLQPQIPVGGRADEAFGSIDGFRIESAPSDVSSSFVSDLSTLPNAVALTESVGLRYVSATSSSGPDSIVIALALAPDDPTQLTSFEQALVDGVSGGSPTEIVTLGGEPAVLVDTVDQTTGEAFQMVFWSGNGLDLLVVGLVDDRTGIEQIADAFIQANSET
jgi:hypothetical protein